MEISRLLWGVAVLDHLPKTLAVTLCKRLASLPLTSFTAETLDQILQVWYLRCCGLVPQTVCRVFWLAARVVVSEL